MLKTKLIERYILELGLIVTVNYFQVDEMLIVQPQSQAPKLLKDFILTCLLWSEPEKDRQCPYGVTVRVAQSSRC
jgi:hypothetical protein